MFGSTIWTRSSLTTDGRPTTSPFVENIYAIVVQFLHSYILAANRDNSQISEAHVFLTWRKRITSRISQMAWLSNTRHMITLSVETRTSQSQSQSHITTYSQSASVRRPSGARDQFFFLLEIFFRQLRVCYFVAPSLTRGWVCNLLFLLVPASAVPLGSALSDERSGLSFVIISL
jgi:hypothetical protein